MSLSLYTPLFSLRNVGNGQRPDDAVVIGSNPAHLLGCNNGKGKAAVGGIGGIKYLCSRFPGKPGDPLFEGFVVAVGRSDEDAPRRGLRREDRLLGGSIRAGG